MHSAKQAAAVAALELIPIGSIVGMGTGSTVNFLIDALAAQASRIKGAVASSQATADRLQASGIDVLDLNMTGQLELYIDGADEANGQLQLIKGGGGALTREKIVAAASERFICIADDSKQVRHTRRISATCRGDSDGAEFCRETNCQAGCRPGISRGSGHRQR